MFIFFLDSVLRTADLNGQTPATDYSKAQGRDMESSKLVANSKKPNNSNPRFVTSLTEACKRIPLTPLELY